jgi:hypothetical protein
VKARVEDVDALKAISPSALAAYVRAEGWTAVERFGKHSDVYQRSGASELIIPGTAAIADYPEVVLSLLNSIATEEGRDQLSVYRDLVVADRDVIRVRAPDADDDGSIKIESGVELVLHAKDLLMAAACAAREPRAAYRAGKNKDASDYMGRVRLGQTEQGSFIVTLLAPATPSLDALGTQTALWPELASEPFDRKVTRMLADSLQAASNAAEGAVRNEGLAAFTRAVPKGVNANLCEALAALIDSGDGLEVAVTWARTRPAPEARRSISFSKAEAGLFREAASQFRSHEPRPDERFEAFVVKLDRDQTRHEGRVTLRAAIDGQPVSIKTTLPPELYSQATEANDKRLMISLTGDLKRKGQRWQLDDPRDLNVILDDVSEDDDDTAMMAQKFP